MMTIKYDENFAKTKTKSISFAHYQYKKQDQKLKRLTNINYIIISLSSCSHKICMKLNCFYYFLGYWNTNKLLNNILNVGLVFMNRSFNIQDLEIALTLYSHVDAIKVMAIRLVPGFKVPL